MGSLTYANDTNTSNDNRHFVFAYWQLCPQGTHHDVGAQSLCASVMLINPTCETLCHFGDQVLYFQFLGFLMCIFFVHLCLQAAIPKHVCDMI